jgi:hypothetical protein
MLSWMHPLCLGCGVRHSKDTPCPDGTKWAQGNYVCRICSHKQHCVIPVPPGEPFPPRNVECGNCHNMTCDPVECEA